MNVTLQDDLERRKDETLKAHRMLASLKVQRGKFISGSLNLYLIGL